ncbi:MAG: triose-phosphate isomerase [Proteobacteria bacterium]|nr:triose-phosphate isomerase [Pseudomonadota bacterium]MBU1715309.1 triose-phosphate isomerase [Pseudomonadota bacterium]
MSRKPLIAGNWKMNTSIAEAEHLAQAIVRASADLQNREVMIAPPYISLAAVADILADSEVILAAQNICWAEKGAFTGEISPPMLKDIGCRMAIVGHSERRHLFGENDAMINKRISGAMEHGIIPVFCIGETLAEREADNTMKILEDQVRHGLKDISITDAGSIVIAYEPVWAIGTGKTATTKQVQEVHHFLRNLMERLYEKNIASEIRILYGGSVNATNVDELMAQPDVDGALVGGAALDAGSFERIINFQ